MARTTLTFTRDSSADIKSSYARDTSNDIITTSVVGEVVVGSTVKYNVDFDNNIQLYAWEDSSKTVVYTNTPNPTSNDKVYYRDGTRHSYFTIEDGGDISNGEIRVNMDK